MTEQELIKQLRGDNSKQSKKELAEFHKQHSKEKDERER